MKKSDIEYLKFLLLFHGIIKEKMGVIVIIIFQGKCPVCQCMEIL